MIHALDLLAGLKEPQIQRFLRELVISVIQHQVRIETVEKSEFGYGGDSEKYIEVRLILETEDDSLIVSTDTFNL
jgi:hypothetical protein